MVYAEGMQTSDTSFSLSDAEWHLITGIDQLFPDKHITENFRTYLALPPMDRMAKAQEDRKTVLRAGWKRRGIPDDAVETLHDHVASMKRLALDYIARHPNITTIIDIIDSHDTGEVIIGDFIPGEFLTGDDITKQDKDKIELLAIQLIYEAQPHMVERYLDYAERRNIESRIVKDLDKGQMFLRAKEYAVTHPAIDLSEFFLDSQNYAWGTQEGVTLFYQAFKKLS